jgi:hypothetical protein
MPDAPILSAPSGREHGAKQDSIIPGTDVEEAKEADTGAWLQKNLGSDMSASTAEQVVCWLRENQCGEETGKMIRLAMFHSLYKAMNQSVNAADVASMLFFKEPHLTSLYVRDRAKLTHWFDRWPLGNHVDPLIDKPWWLKLRLSTDKQAGNGIYRNAFEELCVRLNDIEGALLASSDNAEMNPKEHLIEVLTDLLKMKSPQRLAAIQKILQQAAPVLPPTTLDPCLYSLHEGFGTLNMQAMSSRRDAAASNLYLMGGFAVPIQEPEGLTPALTLPCKWVDDQIVSRVQPMLTSEFNCHVRLQPCTLDYLPQWSGVVVSGNQVPPYGPVSMYCADVQPLQEPLTISSLDTQSDVTKAIVFLCLSTITLDLRARQVGLMTGEEPDVMKLLNCFKTSLRRLPSGTDDMKFDVQVNLTRASDQPAESLGTCALRALTMLYSALNFEKKFEPRWWCVPAEAKQHVRSEHALADSLFWYHSWISMPHNVESNIIASHAVTSIAIDTSSKPPSREGTVLQFTADLSRSRDKWAKSLESTLDPDDAVPHQKEADSSRKEVVDKTALGPVDIESYELLTTAAKTLKRSITCFHIGGKFTVPSGNSTPSSDDSQPLRVLFDGESFAPTEGIELDEKDVDLLLRVQESMLHLMREVLSVAQGLTLSTRTRRCTPGVLPSIRRALNVKEFENLPLLYVGRKLTSSRACLNPSHFASLTLRRDNTVIMPPSRTQGSQLDKGLRELMLQLKHSKKTAQQWFKDEHGKTVEESTECGRPMWVLPVLHWLDKNNLQLLHVQYKAEVRDVVGTRADGIARDSAGDLWVLEFKVGCINDYHLARRNFGEPFEQQSCSQVNLYFLQLALTTFLVQKFSDVGKNEKSPMRCLLVRCCVDANSNLHVQGFQLPPWCEGAGEKLFNRIQSERCHQSHSLAAAAAPAFAPSVEQQESYASVIASATSRSKQSKARGSTPAAASSSGSEGGGSQNSSRKRKRQDGSDAS